MVAAITKDLIAPEESSAKSLKHLWVQKSTPIPTQTIEASIAQNVITVEVHGLKHN
jgi:hypothetical protein